MIKKLLLAILLFFFFEKNYSQRNLDETIFPEIGKKCPSFILNDVQYYIKTHVELNDFKGKWLIIDCWNRYCSSCIASMSRTDSLQKEFAGSVQFLLVGYTGSQYTRRSDDKPIRELYKKIRKRTNIQLPIAYDSVLFHRFDIGACPFIIIVDPNGILRGMTYEITRENIEDFLAGKQLELPRVVTLGEELEQRLIEEQRKLINGSK